MHRGMPGDRATAHDPAPVGESFDKDTNIDSDHPSAAHTNVPADFADDFTAKRKISRTISKPGIEEYNEEYLELFNANQRGDSPRDEFKTSQIGSVTWTAQEKSVFFDALSRKGRHNLPAIANAISTKSEVEVRDYLMRLKDAYIERQRYEPNTKNVSQAEMDAAIEIDSDLEELLNGAADALAATQDDYDLSKAENEAHGPWLIDSYLAANLSSKADEKENEGGQDSSESVASDTEQDDGLDMFHLDQLLELSRNLFMNMPTRSCFAHWNELADEHYPEPAITVDALGVFRNIVRSFTQKILQTTIFLAESRLRATSTRDYAPARVVKDIDVNAALDVLAIPADAFEYWARFPRRSGLRVFLGIHDKGQSGDRPLTPEEIDNVLSVRAARGRRPSLSSMMGISPKDGDSTDGDSGQSGIQAQEVLEDNTEPGAVDYDSDESEYEHTEDSEDSYSSHQYDTEETRSEPRGNEHISRKRRQMMMEEAEEDFLEEIDHLASLKEATYLRDLLGFLPIGEEPVKEPGRRPKKARKTEDELVDWSDVAFKSSWEQYHPSVERPESPSHGLRSHRR